MTLRPAFSRVLVPIAAFAALSAPACSPERRGSEDANGQGAGAGDGGTPGGDADGAAGAGDVAGAGEEGEGEPAVSGEGEGEAAGGGDGAEGEGEGAAGPGDDGPGEEGPGEEGEGEGDGGEEAGEEAGEEGGGDDCDCGGQRGLAQGVLEFVGVEGGCYRLNTDQGGFELIGPQAGQITQRQNVGNTYSINYVTCPEMASICQVGQIVCVQEFQLLQGGGDACQANEQECGANCCKADEQCCAGVPIPRGEEYCIGVNDPGGCPMG